MCRDLAPLSSILLLALLPALTFAEEPAGSAKSREALALCHRAQAAPEADAQDALTRSLALADEAVASDDKDALAYFARFCALGEQARRSGTSLSSLVKLWSIRDAVDRTLELAPDFPDALFGKGAFLSSVPRLLGGDPKEGERLVRRALQIDPNYVGARLFLAESLDERDQHDAARAEARAALAAAERKGDTQGVSQAQQVLSKIGD